MALTQVGARDAKENRDRIAVMKITRLPAEVTAAVEYYLRFGGLPP